MSAPWVFREIKQYLLTGEILAPPPLRDQWALIRRHCALTVATRGDEIPTMHSMRARLMAYSRGMPEAKALRLKFQHVSTLAELDAIAEEQLAREDRICFEKAHEPAAAC
jgi:tRNA-dihydrouridine synthase B